MGHYYEDQKTEALRFSKEFRKDRIPKFFGYFNKALKYNKAKGASGKYLVGDKLTYADTTLFHVIDGVSYAFPTRVEELKAEGAGFEELWAFYEGIKAEENIKSYLESDRRLAYKNGIFRYYAELDVDQE